MAPTKFPPAVEVKAEATYIVEMLEPQSDAELGRKLSVGDVLKLPETKARKWVEDLGIARLTTEAKHREFLAERSARADARMAENTRGNYSSRIPNANALNAEAAALARGEFDRSRLPRVNEAAVAAAEQRGARTRLGAPGVGGETLEQQLAALDAAEVAKGNIPVSVGMRGDEFPLPGESPSGTLPGTMIPGAAPISGSLAPTFEDLGDEDLEGDGPADVDPPKQTGAKGKSGK